MFKRLRSGYQHVPLTEGREKREGNVVERIGEAVSWSSWTARAIAATVVFGILLLSISGTSVVDTTPPRRLVTPVGTDARYLHFVIPANRKDIQLCKTLVGSQALNYPLPSIVNWGKQYDNATLAAGGWHLAKVEGVLSYLKDLGQERDLDVIIIPKAYETWLQLRPGVLLERFFEINRKANAKLASRLGGRAMRNEHVSQTIIFSAQKTCPVGKADDIACYASPHSTLPRYAYGPETDKQNLKENPSYLKFRERYIDSGLIVGEVGSIRKLFEKAQAVIQANPQSTDLIAFAKIFGEQEYHREVIRDLYSTPIGRLMSSLRWFLGFEQVGLLENHPAHRQTQPAEGVQLEFGIGLDYEGMLSQSTLSAEIDSEWLRYNDTKAISETMKKLKTAGHPKAVAGDILRSLPPFWSPNGAEDGFPQDEDWSNLPLYTNLNTGNIPVAMRMDSSSDRTKALWQSGWAKMWYHSEARKLQDLYVNEPFKSFAVLRGGGMEMAWWPRYEQKWETARRPGNPDHDWVRWKELCDGFEAELFQDGQGAWEPPRKDY
ncbi:hypothetical protein F5884DRAFT_396763 [Xylogone sp. PMI_703]|nr:hypothetical protein F5884DRAFT_396763 [Xylogone sp. PMI_703]